MLLVDVLREAYSEFLAMFSPDFQSVRLILYNVFLLYSIYSRNINDNQNRTYLTRCQYSSSKENRLCPIIKLKTIFDEISDTAFGDAAIKVRSLSCLIDTNGSTYTHVKISQLVASLLTSCQQLVFSMVVPSCRQV